MEEDDSPTLFSRARVAVSRRVVAAFKASPRLRARLGSRRAAPIDGRTFDEAAAAMLALDDLDHGSDLRRLSLRAARAKLAEQVAIVDAPAPSGVSAENRVVAGPAGPLRARLYVPDGLAGALPAIAFFHGGGFVTGSIATHDGLCRRLALGARCRVVSFEYRRAPEARFPAAVDDGLACLRWLFAHAAELGIDGARVAVAGDSAGGNLSAVLSLRTRGDAARPALQVLMYPATDATCSLPSHASMGQGFLLTRDMIAWYYDHYLGPDPELRRHPDISPLLAPDVAGAPAALVYTAGFDPLRDEGSAYAERLSRAGVTTELREQPSWPHGFALMTRALEAGRAAVEGIASDIASRLGSAG